MSISQIAIIGGGLAGLTAALSFARRGISVDVLEQAPQVTEVGAGLQVSPNASRILRELDVLPELEAKWTEPDTLRLVDGRTLRTLTAMPVGQHARQRWGAPYGVLHRATLQQALLHQVLTSDRCRLHLGHRLETATPDSVAAITGQRPDVIVGADGVWSSVRQQIASAPTVRFSGNIAWRFTLAKNRAPAFLDNRHVSAFLGPDCHLVCYPLSEIDSFNIVAITAGESGGESWSSVGGGAQRSLMIRRFSGWHGQIRQLLESAEAPTFWPLYEAGDGRWHNGRDTVLIGDAAHAMMPFSAQGAAMAIEDGWELAGLLARHDASTALPAFETRRKARVARVRQRGNLNRFAYHARGPARLARDFVFSLRAPESLLADLDWLYGYSAAD